MIATGMLHSGCSLQQSADQARSTLQQMRLDHAVGIDQESQFLLPVDANVVVRNGAPGDHRWIGAATAGVNRVFPPYDGARPSYQIVVEWPELEVPNGLPSRQRGTVASLLAVHEWPTLPKRAKLPVQVIDPSGMLLHSFQLTLSPALWQPDWQADELLTASFADLARAITGQ